MCTVGGVVGNWKVRVLQVERIARENVWDYRKHDVFRELPMNWLKE